MKLENGEITKTQLTFLLYGFLQSMILTVGFTFSITKQSTWLVVIIAAVISLLTALMYVSIARKFLGDNLIQINDTVFGPYLGKLISALYIWFFFQTMIHCIYFFNSFWTIYIMPNTPRIVFLIMFGFICAMAVRKGIEVIARCSFLLVCLVVFATVLVTVFSIGNMDMSNLLPVFDASFKDFVQSTHIMVTIPFCDMVVFLMILPYTSQKQEIKKPVLVGICLSAIHLLVVVLRDILVLGPKILTSESASFAVTRQINIAGVITRMDILIALALIFTVFIKVTIFYYATALSVAEMFKLRTYRPLVIPIGITAMVIASTLYSSDMQQVYAAKFVWPFNATVYEFLIPMVTWIIILIRRLPKKKRGGETE